MEKAHSTDRSIRNAPKSSNFCEKCQRPLCPPAYVYLSENRSEIVHPDQLDGTEIKVFIGPVCLKRAPKEFIVNS